MSSPQRSTRPNVTSTLRAGLCPEASGSIVVVARSVRADGEIEAAEASSGSASCWLSSSADALAASGALEG